MCFDFLYDFETFLILRRIRRGIVINVKTSSCKLHVILVGFYTNLSFLDRLKREFKYQISSKLLQWEPSCSMQTDGRTDMTS